LARKTQTRERLINTATDLFLRQGYAQSGVNEIMQQAQATSGSFYHFFPTKEDLLLAVLDHLGEMLEDEVFTPAIRSTDDPIGRIFAVLEYYRQHLEKNEFKLGSPIGTLAAELSDSHPQVRLKLVELLALWSGKIEIFLSEASDFLPRDIDHEALAQFVLSAMEGAVIQARANRSLSPFDASVAELRRHFDSLRVNSVPPEPVRPPTVVGARSGQRSADWRTW
jgi:AcrR family transcriptional regulator